MAFTFWENGLKKAGAYEDYRDHVKGGMNWRWQRDPKQIQRIVLHHSVTNVKRNAHAEFHDVANVHIGARGWGGVGYHFIITTEVVNGYAKVLYVGDIATTRAHAPNTKGAYGLPKGKGNDYTIGICIIGRFDKGTMPYKAQLRSAHRLCKELFNDERTRLPNIRTNWGAVVGHKELDATACPGDLDKLIELVKNIEPVPPRKSNTTEPKPEPSEPVDVPKESDSQTQDEEMLDDRNELIQKILAAIKALLLRFL